MPAATYWNQKQLYTKTEVNTGCEQVGDLRDTVSCCCHAQQEAADNNICRIISRPMVLCLLVV